MRKFYIAWNNDQTEGFVTDSPEDALVAASGESKGLASFSSLGEAFREVYDEDNNVYEDARLLDESEVALPLAKIWEWSEQTFGDGLRTKGVIQHITKELKEIEETPFDLEEWTDLILLSLDGFWRHCDKNLTKQQMAELLSENIAAKFAKNQTRDWPDWRNLPEDVAIEHTRTLNEAKPIVIDKLGIWRCRFGRVVEITELDPAGDFPVHGVEKGVGSFSWTRYGGFLLGNPHERDLVEYIGPVQGGV